MNPSNVVIEKSGLGEIFFKMNRVGLQDMIGLFNDLLERQKISFSAEFEGRRILLNCSIGEETSIRIRNEEIVFVLETEDLLDSIERFEQTFKKGDFNTVEWLQAIHIPKGIRQYLFVAMLND